MLLHDLFVLQNYYGETQSIMYEDDLIRLYGQDDVQSAIQEGLIDHGWIPCASGRKRCVCRLSDKGQSQIQAQRQN
jgi:hypothetical protein